MDNILFVLSLVTRAVSKCTDEQLTLLYKPDMCDYLEVVQCSLDNKSDVFVFEDFGSDVVQDHGWKNLATSTKKTMYHTIQRYKCAEKNWFCLGNKRD